MGEEASRSADDRANHGESGPHLTGHRGHDRGDAPMGL